MAVKISMKEVPPELKYEPPFIFENAITDQTTDVKD